MKIYETDIRLDECIQIMQNVISTQEGDIEFSVRDGRVEISVKHVVKKFKFWQSPWLRKTTKIPVIFYGKLSLSRIRTILSGSFEIASAWKMLCTVLSFAALLFASILLGHIIFGQIPFTANAKSELISYYGFTLLSFLTIPLIKYTNRNDEKTITLFLEQRLNFRLKKERTQFSQSDITTILALLMAQILGFAWAMIF